MMDLKTLRALLAAATPGPWRTDMDVFDASDGWAATLLDSDGFYIGDLPTEISPAPAARAEALEHRRARDAALIVAAVNALPELLAEREQLMARLPDGMKDCTIVFRECARGHGWLTATNWTQHGCPTCEREQLLARAEAADRNHRDAVDRATEAHRLLGDRDVDVTRAEAERDRLREEVVRAAKEHPRHCPAAKPLLARAEKAEVERDILRAKLADTEQGIVEWRLEQGRTLAEVKDLRAKLEAAEARAKRAGQLRADDLVTTVAMHKRAEAAEADNARLRDANKRWQDRWEYTHDEKMAAKDRAEAAEDRSAAAEAEVARLGDELIKHRAELISLDELEAADERMAAFARLSDLVSCRTCGQPPSLECRSHFVRDLATKDARIAELERDIARVEKLRALDRAEVGLFRNERDAALREVERLRVMLSDNPNKESR